MADKTKQDLLLEKRDIQLEINKLAAEKHVVEDQLRGLFAAAGEARVRKERLDAESKAIKQHTDDLQESHSAFIEDVRLSLRFAEDVVAKGREAINALNAEFDTQKKNLEEIRDEQDALEESITKRKKDTAVIVKDLNIYADRLTAAYSLNMPNRKVVVGDINAVNKTEDAPEEPKEDPSEPINRDDIPEIPGFDMSKIVVG